MKAQITDRYTVLVFLIPGAR